MVDMFAAVGFKFLDMFQEILDIINLLRRINGRVRPLSSSQDCL